jgi:hypothetical protein
MGILTMFEIVKLFIKEAMKVINIKDLVKARKDSRLASLGVEMFDLYSSLNGVLVCGLRIVDQIESLMKEAKRAKTTRCRHEHQPQAAIAQAPVDGLIDYAMATLAKWLIYL